MGMAYETDGQYENAIEQCKKAIVINPYVYASYIPLIYSYIQVNQIDKAQSYANEFLKVAPKLSLNLFRVVEPFKSPKRTENYVNALRKAGLPD